MSSKSSAGPSKRSEKENSSERGRSRTEFGRNRYRENERRQTDRSADRSPTQRVDIRGSRGRERGRGEPRKDERSSQGRSGRADSVSKLESSHSQSRAERDMEDGKRSESKTYLEDTRIFRLLRKAGREDDRERRLSILKQLREAFELPENRKILSRGMEQVLIGLQAIFFERTFKDVKQESAVCMGMVGAVLGSDSEGFFQWVFTQLNSTSTDEAKILYISALHQAVKSEGKNAYSEIIQMVMTNMQTALENADSPTMLMAVVDVLQVVAKAYPDVFSSHFRDTVDILVGWHIDTSQKESVTEYASTALAGFQQFWASDMSFSLTLLGQFLEDMEAYTDDLGLSLGGQPSTEEDVPTPAECITKIESLLRVFTTVLRSLGGYFLPIEGGAVTVEYAVDTLERILKCVNQAYDAVASCKVLVAANKCVYTLVSKLELETVKVMEPLLMFLGTQVMEDKEYGDTYTMTLLTLLHKTVEFINVQLPVEFITKLLGPGSLLLTLRFIHNSQVLSKLLAIYHFIMGFRNVPLLEEAYRLVVGDLEAAYNSLLRRVDCDYQSCVVAENPFLDSQRSASQEEAIIIFDICALAEIGNTKNNLIGMWALSPSLFSLLTEHLKPNLAKLAEAYPAVQYAVLQTLYSHCSRHSHFISSSSLATQSPVLDSPLLGSVNPSTSGHFSICLALLVKILRQPKTPYDSCSLVLKWCADIIQNLKTTGRVYACREFTALVDALVSLGYTDDSDICEGVCDCLQSLFKNTSNVNALASKRVMELCSVKLTDTDREIRRKYRSLLENLPFHITSRMGHSSTSVEVQQNRSKETLGTMEQLWLARRSYIAKEPKRTFHSHNFRTVMAYILQGEMPHKLGQTEWLERLYHSCQRLDEEGDKAGEQASFSCLVDGNANLQWFWATWEAAQFCVQAKLRTPLGKPQDTFTSIEAELKKYASQVRGRVWGEDAKSSSDLKRGEEDKLYQEQHRVNLLLLFLEHLEKLLYNAAEGCAVAMATPPKVVRTFFRTNKGTCHEWLIRIRTSIIQVALYLGQYAIVVRQAHELLHDMKIHNNTHVAEFEQVLMYLVRALACLRCPEAIQGVYTWCKEVTNRRLAWIKAALSQAHCRYEDAAMEFQSALKTYIAPENLLDEARDKENKEASPAESPVGSPLFGSGSKINILGKHVHDPSPDPLIANYMVNQVTDCYLKLYSLEDVLDWQESLHQYRQEHSSSPLQKAFSTNLDINYIKAWHNFECKDFDSMHNDLELVAGSSMNDLEQLPHLDVAWCNDAVIKAAQLQLLRASVLCHTSDWHRDKSELQACLTSSHKIATSTLHSGALWWPPLLETEALAHASLVNFVKKQTLDPSSKDCRLFASSDIQYDYREHNISTALQALQLADYQAYTQQVYGNQGTTDLMEQCSRLRLAAANLARKQDNFTLAEHLLVEEIHIIIDPDFQMFQEFSDVQSALASIQTDEVILDPRKQQRIEREVAKLLHKKGDTKDAVSILAASAVTHADSQVSLCHELCARSVLTLVSWLQADHKHLASLASQVKEGNTDGTSQLLHKLNTLLLLEETQAAKGHGIVHVGEDGIVHHVGDSPTLADSDAIVGRLLHLATMQCCHLSKAWFSLAGWCYKWGRKAVDNACHGSVELTTEEKAAIISLLPKGIKNNETEAVFSILSQIHAGITSDEDISDQDQSLYDDGAETTRKQLISSCLALQVASDECIDGLIDIWKGVVRHTYFYYQLSAKAYFTYLKNNGQADESVTNMDGNVTATLRLLRLLVKHAWELRNVLEDGLAHTPTAPWKGIIPQLFSRLNHPEPYVRQSVSELLCRVAQDAPHLIVYPAVVGCSTKIVAKDTSRDVLLSEYLSQEEGKELEDGENKDDADDNLDEEAELMDESNSAMLQNCFSAITDTLAHHNPQMISEVQLLVSELRRITLLWDELWLGTLNQQYADVSRRLSQLENEVKKVMANSSLSKEEKTAIIRLKHNTVLKPTVFVMERLRDITAAPAETPQEEWFQQVYGKTIEEALERLKNPSSPSQPHTSWHLFKQLHSSLQQRAAKRSSLVLSMEKISPRLASFRTSATSMPGISNAGQVVTIEFIHNTVQILPTKTKPKKLLFMGSDGKRYPYLFKGLEDLHLDERIMQFLSIVNNMFAKANRGERKLYFARHYSVTPLGARSGLIQWVDGATPLFSLYKRWQQREAMAQANKPGQAPTTNNPAAAIARPSEIFYKKLTPALEAKGITDLENRKDWPLSTMRQVLQELMAETPNQLLARELWCSSAGPQEWWEVTQTYSRSTAVMSMIGYIIGLGDRHLDNVLVDLGTGEVVHIDYNVCFEKGKSLRVPEKVPFRMTQNIEEALGVTGIEGIFRISCEYVIKTMRKGRETLLTLLEAFVYDPLVDWTTGNEGGYTGAFYGGGHFGDGTASKQSKRDMEHQITHSMFAIRVAEMKAAWIRNREEMYGCLPLLLQALNTQLEAQQDLMRADHEVAGLREQRAYLEQAKDDPQHEAYTLQTRYDEYAVVKKAREDSMVALQDKLNECESWLKAHQTSLKTLQSGGLQKMCGEVSQPINANLAAFSSVADFLQGAGQGQLLAQCEQCESEITGLVHQRRAVLRSCLDVLHTYATIAVQFPQSEIANHRTARWQTWTQQLVSDFTLNRVHEVYQEYQSLYGPGREEKKANMDKLLEMEARLQSMAADAKARLVKLYERRAVETTDTSTLALHLTETTSAIHRFVKESGPKGMLSMTAALVSALTSLSRRYLIMEGAAADAYITTRDRAAGDRLMDLTSREGDWFLDELCSMSGNVHQLLAMLVTVCQPEAEGLEDSKEIIHALDATHTVYMGLQDLNVNFRSIIVPEALKSIQTGEASMQALLTSLDSIIKESGQSLDSLLAKLEVQLRNAIMGMQTNVTAVQLVKKMQSQFDELLQAAESESSEPSALTPGQMLLMGFNGLFTRLDADFHEMQDALSKVNVPDIWRKVDVVREARSMQLTAFNENTVGLLSSLFFLKRLAAMQEFFNMCRKAVQESEIAGGTVYYDSDQFARPVKHYIAEYVRKQMVGLPTQTLGYALCTYISFLGINVTAEIELKDIGAESKVLLEDLCKKTVDSNLRQENFEHVHLTQASALIGAADVAWRKSDLAKRLDSNIELLKSNLQRQQVELAAFQWLHEDALLQSGHSGQQMLAPARANVMQEIRKAAQSLVAQETSMAGIQERQQQLVASVTQRLKWAAGANPTLHTVLQTFEEALTLRNGTIETESKLSTEVTTLCNAVLHFEALRTHTQEAVTADANFLALLKRCEESCVITESCTSTVSDLEEQLMARRPLQPGEVIDVEWMKNALDLTNKEISGLNGKLGKLTAVMDTCKEGVKAQVTSIRTILSTHHKLMSDIRSILKSLAKKEEQEFGMDSTGGIIEYMNTYKTFSEKVTGLLRAAQQEEVSSQLLVELQQMADTVSQHIPRIYDDLVGFAPPLLTLTEGGDGQQKLSFASALKKGSENAEACLTSQQPLSLKSHIGCESPTPDKTKLGTPIKSKSEKITRDPRTGKALQERNSYAVSVWRRVKMKLDGRDPDSNKRATVAEQVDYVIEEAKNLDNLALLYEGWTPWV